MSEWLSTGQMIDQLQVGEFAESDDERFLAFWNDDKWLSFKIPTSESIEHQVIHNDKNRKWRILPQYITFTEAMKALEDGKTVCYHGINNYDVTPYTYKLKLSGLSISDISIHDLVNGKWTIKEESN